MRVWQGFMIRILGITVSSIFVVVAAWYGVWRMTMASDVARVKATIAYQDAQFKNKNRYMTLKTNDVYATGFPFHGRVRVEQPTLSYIFMDETYAASLAYIDLTPRDESEGSYEAAYPNLISALYAKSGSAPETYTVTMDTLPGLLLRAQGDSTQCSGFPGQPRCADAALDAPLISAALKLPPSITITMTLNGETKTATFQTPSMSVPIYQTIPAGMDDVLQLAVGVLREAMVFRKEKSF